MFLLDVREEGGVTKVGLATRALVVAGERPDGWGGFTIAHIIELWGAMLLIGL